MLPLDVTDAEAVERAAAAVEAQWGRIDVWINNAMAIVFAPVTQTTADEYRLFMLGTMLAPDWDHRAVGLAHLLYGGILGAYYKLC